MKAEIHPKLNHVVFIDSSSGAEFPTLSTLSAKETKKINGVEHFVIHVDITSASHPFYTGKNTLVDTAGRVDKFRAKMEASRKLQEATKEKKVRKSKIEKETPIEKVTRKAKENTERKAAEKADALAAKKKTAAKNRAAKKEEKKEGEES